MVGGRPIGETGG